MDPIYKPLTNEEKQRLEAKGYKEWQYYHWPRWSDPDEMSCN